jgi:hypothetical protein
MTKGFRILTSPIDISIISKQIFFPYTNSQLFDKPVDKNFPNTNSLQMENT